MKKVLIVMTAMALSLALATPQAHAGSPQSHRWEGVAIGVGAAILGSALFNSYQRQAEPAPVVYAPRASKRHHHRGYRSRGHWEIQKTWVAPVYTKLWNPGHYDRRGCWVAPGWIQVEKEPGYWEEQRVWVARR